MMVISRIGVAHNDLPGRCGKLGLRWICADRESCNIWFKSCGATSECRPIRMGLSNLKLDDFDVMFCVTPYMVNRIAEMFPDEVFYVVSIRDRSILNRRHNYIKNDAIGDHTLTISKAEWRARAEQQFEKKNAAEDAEFTAFEHALDEKEYSMFPENIVSASVVSVFDTYDLDKDIYCLITRHENIRKMLRDISVNSPLVLGRTPDGKYVVTDNSSGQEQIVPEDLLAFHLARKRNEQDLGHLAGIWLTYAKIN